MKNQPDNYEKSENRVHMTPLSHGQQWNDISEDHQFSAVYELPLDRSVEYYDNKNTENSDWVKMRRNPFRIILGSILSTGIRLQLKNIKSIQRVK